jgi:type IV pilus assembly protein PilM
MALPFFNGASRKKRDQIISVDLGGRTTKAALLERRGEVMALSRFAMMDAPIYDKKMSAELLGDHLRQVVEALGSTTKSISLAVGLDEAVLRQVELPQIPVNEMRLVLKNNSKAYLQQDLPNHVFDCHIFPPKLAANAAKGEPQKAAGIPKLKVLVAAAKQQVINDYLSATKLAGLTAEAVIPGLIGPVNAFEACMPEMFLNDSVALVDMGFKHTSICILDRGDIALTRVVNIGGDKVTQGLADTMSISYAEAEGIKVGMAPEVLSSLELQILPLGRELRASLDFFEHQQDRPVSQVYICGGSARSEMILQMLHSELVIECKAWNPTSFLQIALPGQQAVDVEHLGSQLTVAIGAALAVL